MAEILIDRDRCKGCGQCIEACPQRILAADSRINAKGYLPAEVREPRRCLGCRLCCIACPDLAIEMRATGVVYRYFAY